MLLLSLILAQNDLITAKDGELPIIITAPHGGRLPVPGVEARTGKGIKKFTAVLDTNTDLLAEDIAKAIEKQTGKRPYVVIAHFSRKFIDANRPPEEAYESDAAKPTYDAYEKDIDDDRAAILKKWGAGLLIDIHGQGHAKDTVYRGTNNLKTVSHWLSAYGAESLTGKDGFLGKLEADGVKLFPAVGSSEKEYSALDGGYTVQHFGSSKGGTFDAIQLEFGGDYRKKDARMKTATDVADAVEIALSKIKA